MERDVQILQADQAARQIGYYGVSQGNRDGATSSQSVEPIGKIHRIGTTRDDDHEERNGQPGEAEKRLSHQRKTDLADLKVLHHRFGDSAPCIRAHPIRNFKKVPLPLLHHLAVTESEAGNLGLEEEKAGRQATDHKLPEKFLPRTDAF